MDRHLAKLDSDISYEEMQLICITSLFICSKFHEVNSLTLEDCANLLANQQVDEEVIRVKEQEILRSV